MSADSGAAELQSTTAMRRPLQFVALVLAVVLCWLVVRVTLAAALVEVRPDLAAALAPNHPEAVVASGTNARQETQEAARDNIAALLKRAPLADEPLLLALQDAEHPHKAENAGQLLDEVISRNPRSRQAHLLRLAEQIEENRVEEAALTVAVLSRLMPNSGSLLIEELAKLSSSPAARQSILRVVEADGAMRSQLLEALARQGADPDTIFSLAGPVQPSAYGQAPRWQTLMLGQLVSQGQIARAHRVWSQLAGVDATSSLIYDADFQGLPGPPPFNWNLEASPEGLAEMSASGRALYVEFYGRRDAVLGSQLLTLAPGEYRLSFDADGSASGDGGRLAWTIACQSGGSALVTLPIEGLDVSSQAFSAPFVVPERCSAQWLRLAGKFGEFPKDQRATISNFRIAKAGQ